MREIVFRGKRVDNGEWVEGFLLKDTSFYGKPENHVYIFNHEQPSGCFGRDIFIEVDPATVGQYTGLTAKNGKKIFEGDICRNTKTNEIVSVKWHGTMACYVWSKRRADNGNLYDFGELFRAFDKYEVIGNIHDNPELMGGTENVSHP